MKKNCASNIIIVVLTGFFFRDLLANPINNMVLS